MRISDWSSDVCSSDLARDNVTINNLLPERFDTDRQEQMARVAMKRDDISYEEARRRQVDSIAARRLGQPEEFGAMCAFLCSALAGFVYVPHVHLAGGSYPALGVRESPEDGRVGKTGV